jgi:integrase/recombinase XerC
MAALEGFLQALADEGRAAWTVRKYAHAARTFLAWADGAGGVRALTRADIQTYLRRWEAPASRRWHLAVVRRVLAYLRAEGALAAEDVTAGVRTPPPKRRPPRVITPEEEAALLAVIERGRKTDGLVLWHLLRGSGLRVGEAAGYRNSPARGGAAGDVCGVRAGDVRLDRLTMDVPGKGGETLPALLTHEGAAVIARHIITLRDLRPEAPLLQDRDGRPRGERWARRRLWQWGQRAQLARHITPHMLRHTFGTALLEGGADLRAVQRLLRHRRLTSTLVYADYVHDEALRAVFDRAQKGGRP